MLFHFSEYGYFQHQDKNRKRARGSRKKDIKGRVHFVSNQVVQQRQELQEQELQKNPGYISPNLKTSITMQLLSAILISFLFLLGIVQAAPLEKRLTRSKLDQFSATHW